MDIITLTYFIIFGIFFISLLLPALAILYFFRERRRFKGLTPDERKVLSFIIRKKTTRKGDIEEHLELGKRKTASIIRSLETKHVVVIRGEAIRHKKSPLFRKTKNI